MLARGIDTLSRLPSSQIQRLAIISDERDIHGALKDLNGFGCSGVGTPSS